MVALPKRAMILGGLTGQSVEINGVIIPGRSIEDRLVRHAFNLVVHNDDPVYRVSIIGSATAVRFRDRYILLCTNHQLDGFDPERVAMLLDDGGLLVTSGGYRSPRITAETDACDLAAFDFTEPVLAHPSLSSRFFNIREVPPPTAQADIIGFVLAGFPSTTQDYDLEANNHLGTSRFRVLCLPDGFSNDPALIRLRATTTINVNPDGMSGGSVFVIQVVEGRFHAYFAGIIARGGTEFFHVLDPGFVTNFLNIAFASSDE